MSRTADFLVIGGGIVGLTLALEARRRHPGSSITVLEKEDRCGAHGSTRNSGVLHAGFYYTADSLKAKLTVDGNRRLTEYCLERQLPINQCGKLVVAQDDRELATLDELLARGRANGVALEPVAEVEARKLEPRVRTVGRALFSPTTSSVDAGSVMASLVADCRGAGIAIETGTPYVGRRQRNVLTPHDAWSCGFLINAAGLYADRIAHDFDTAHRYVILPFKGVYLYGSDDAPRLRRHIYPVPDLANPFLGVHLTVTADGQPKIGPSAMPAFWREHYGGTRNFRPGEFLEVVGREVALFIRNDFNFRSLAWHELRKYSRRFLTGLASRLANGIDPAHYRTWGRAGIRAQLYDRRSRSLVMDFCFVRDERALHVLNAVSPAFTCSFAFAEYLFDVMGGVAAA